jgi:hypothetical protein
MIDSHLEKLEPDKPTICAGIVTRESSPKYRTIDACFKSIRNDPKLENKVEDDSTRMSRNPLPQNADPSMLTADPGIKSNSSDEQSQKASASISRTIEMASN